MKKLFKFKYLKTLILVVSIIIAYSILQNNYIKTLIQSLDNLNYLGIFIAGFLFSFGFTAPFAVSFFILSNPNNLLLAALIGGIGSLFSDLLIYKIIKINFMDEFNRLKKTELIKRIKGKIANKLSHKIKNYLMYSFAGIIIASPLPDEIGITMLAGLSHINAKTLGLLSFILHSIAILLLLLL